METGASNVKKKKVLIKNREGKKSDGRGIDACPKSETESGSVCARARPLAREYSLLLFLGQHETSTC